MKEDTFNGKTLSEMNVPRLLEMFESAVYQISHSQRTHSDDQKEHTKVLNGMQGHIDDIRDEIFKKAYKNA